MYIITTQLVDNLLSLTASEEASTDFLITNVKDPLPESVWRSTSLTPNIVFNFASAVSIDFWGVWYTNAANGDQARLRLANSQAALTSAPTLDTGLVDVWPGTGDLSSWSSVHQRATIATPVSTTWGRIDFDYTGNSDGYVEVGALMLAVKWKPVIGHEWDWEAMTVNRAKGESTLVDGGLSRGSYSSKRGVRFSLKGLSEAEVWGGIDEINRERGGVKVVGVVLKENENDYPLNYMYYGYMDVDKWGVHQGRMEAQVTIVEP